MRERRLPPLLLAALLAGAAAAAAVLINLVLLNRATAGNDPVGQLRPHLVTGPSTVPSTSTPAATVPTVRPTHGTIENEGADD